MSLRHTKFEEIIEPRGRVEHAQLAAGIISDGLVRHDNLAERFHGYLSSRSTPFSSLPKIPPAKFQTCTWRNVQRKVCKVQKSSNRGSSSSPFASSPIWRERKPEWKIYIALKGYQRLTSNDIHALFIHIFVSLSFLLDGLFKNAI